MALLSPTVALKFARGFPFCAPRKCQQGVNSELWAISSAIPWRGPTNCWKRVARRSSSVLITHHWGWHWIDSTVYVGLVSVRGLFPFSKIYPCTLRPKCRKMLARFVSYCDCCCRKNNLPLKEIIFLSAALQPVGQAELMQQQRLCPLLWTFRDRHMAARLRHWRVTNFDVTSER